MEYGDGWRLVRDQRTPDGGTLVIWTDITALKNKDAELRAAQDDAARSRQQFYVAIEHSDDGFALWDAEDRFVLCNRKYRERAGAAAELLVPGVTFERFVREGIRLSAVTSPTLDHESLIRYRLELHHRASGEPLEVIRRGGRHIVRDQRTPDGGCLVISTELRTIESVAPLRGKEASPL
jgi:PAS domain-containing protein